jgi:DNA-binding MarR family transcriptional regulator
VNMLSDIIGEPAGVSKDRLEVWRKISDAWRRVHREGEKNISQLGICTTEFRILRFLHETGTTSMARLSSDAGLTQPAITSLIDKLESHAFVKRDRDRKDRRVINIAITSKGESLFRRGLKIHSRFVKGSLAKLSDSELSQLSSMMKKLASTG